MLLDTMATTVVPVAIVLALGLYFVVVIIMSHGGYCGEKNKDTPCFQTR